MPPGPSSEEEDEDYLGLAKAVAVSEESDLAAEARTTAEAAIVALSTAALADVLAAAPALLRHDETSLAAASAIVQRLAVGEPSVEEGTEQALHGRRRRKAEGGAANAPTSLWSLV